MDFFQPEQLYPLARRIRRKIVYHYGPTNSGKTHAAIQKFLSVKTAMYCAPLRLLALEIQERSRALGVPCNLVTGQEKNIVKGSKHMACTVEMAMLHKAWDVVIIDEIQLIGDPNRGSEFTKALLGSQAKEIHVCGDASALSLIKRLAKRIGDEIEAIEYKRFAPLVIEDETVSFEDAKPGDCFIVFSRAQVYKVKEKIRLKCCTIYGALPPETRSAQAKAFNDPNSEYDVLVGTDAIGMGLNLEIRRVIFTSMTKFDGSMLTSVPPSLVKQIAGRAGRRGTQHSECGYVAAMNDMDKAYLVSCLEEPVKNIKRAGFFPTIAQIKACGSRPRSILKIIDQYSNRLLDKDYFFCGKTDWVRSAKELGYLLDGLTLEEQFVFCTAPAKAKSMYFVCMVEEYKANEPVTAKYYLYDVKPGLPLNIDYTKNAELMYEAAMVYVYVADRLRSRAQFPDYEKARWVLSDIGLELAKLLPYLEHDWRISQTSP